ncbi:MAG TPA: flagellar protein FliS [Novosphingobium sp.]|nr:flagellar protein FliS [Novosphingobium sp.]
MLASRDPNQVYRRVDFDARVTAADPAELVKLCFEQLIAAIGSALIAEERGDNQTKSRALTRAISALTALQLGVSGNDSMSQALLVLYNAARKSVLDSALAFHAPTLERIRADFIEIAQSLTGAA